jgi:hypothetical protein
MPNGKLFGYNKLTNAQFEIGLIIEPFSLSDNLNDMPSNMKVRIVNNNREEYQVNTVCFHEDFNTWWVIKADTSTYLKTGEYEHELELVEYFEFFNYKHLITCAFKKDDYTFEQTVNRVFKLGGIVGFSVEYAGFIDKDKKNDFFSFENFTVASALKTIARSVNAIPKLKRVGSTPTLFFISRNGLDETPRTQINSQFPVAFEKNANTSEQFQTRSISNLENVLSSDLVIAPRIGGYLATTKNASALDIANGIGSVILPSKIDRIDYIKLFPKIKVRVVSNIPATNITIYDGYYVDSKKIYDLIQSKVDIDGNPINYFTLAGSITDGELASIVMPSTEEFGKIKLNDGLGNDYKISNKPFAGYLTLKDSLLFRTSNQTNKDKTFYYEQRTNELICAKKFIKGLKDGGFSDDFVDNVELLFKGTGGVSGETTIEIKIIQESIGLFQQALAPYTTFIQVGYVPIGDLKVSYDNDNDAQDEKFFNQSGKLLDSYAVSKLMFSHVQDSVEGTKIRQARCNSLSEVLPLGALISDGGVVYVINQRSIDYVNDYYSVIYNLSRSRIARSENINADGSIREYAIPENNTVRRNQLFKDYFELSLEPSTTTSTTPYINLERLLNLTSDYAGSRFNYQSFSRVKFSTQATKYIGVSTSYYDLYKAKSFVVDFIDNAIIGYRVEEVSGSAVQTPIIYTGENDVNGNLVGNGKTTELEVVTTDEALLADSIAYYENPANALAIGYSVVPFSPFIDMTNVPAELYQNSLVDRSKFVFKYTDLNYGKDPFEIPVFTYQVQANDQYFPSNGTIVGERLFTDYNGGVNGVRYHYVFTNTKITSENADKIYTDNAPSSTTNKRVAFARPNQRQINMTLYSTFSGTLNTTALQGKNIGIYAVDNTTTNPLPPKFLFAINNYQKTSNNAISVYINNWKI